MSKWSEIREDYEVHRAGPYMVAKIGEGFSLFNEKTKAVKIIEPSQFALIMVASNREHMCKAVELDW